MLTVFLDPILELDQALFTLINTKWTNGLFDTMMPWSRNANSWIPLYLLLLVYLGVKMGKKIGIWLLFVAINVAITDQISSHLFKPLVHRLRPCADPAIMQQVKLLLSHCSTGFSFTSSHAANHFGIAMFFVMTLSTYFNKYRYLFFIWAALIAYAQVYVGVHYPLDIIFGGLVGVLVGYLNGHFYNKKIIVATKN